MFSRTLSILGMALLLLTSATLSAQNCPAADFSTTSTSYNEGDPIIFTVTSSTTEEAQFTWELDGVVMGSDGTFSLSSYALEETYSLELTVSDGSCIDDITKTVRFERSPGGNVVIIWP